ncbi:N-acetyltransferase [Brachybacterium sp. EF45031]|nr:GNAT family N-acetyltransferase [Brachybacterium sillae]MCS6710813.1 N-acetyltransferase [Brachybacterium sillae]
MSTDVVVNHNPQEHRFEAHVAGELAGFTETTPQGEDLIVMAHTVVDPEYGGRGIASTLVRTALDAIREAGKTVDPQCSYVRNWIDKHPDYQDLVTQ